MAMSFHHADDGGDGGGGGDMFQYKSLFLQ